MRTTTALAIFCLSPGPRDSRRASTRRDRTVRSFAHDVPPARDASGAPCDDGNDQAAGDRID